MAIDKDQVVAIEFELKVEGEVVDSNIGKDPLEFTFGTGQIITGLEDRIKDMNPGDKAQIVVPTAEAYGEYNPEALQTVPKAEFGDIDLVVGMPLQGEGSDGNIVHVVIKEVLDNDVVVDFNHPLAGKDLDFSITILSVE